MATSEVLGSDILTPSNCGPCLIENKINDATMFCVECNDMLCDTCVGIHRRFPILKNHKIVVQADKEMYEFKASLFTDKCEKHLGKHLETLCKVHDELCCSVCVSLSHRMCDRLVYLPEFFNDKTTKVALKGKIQTIEQMKTSFKEVKKTRQADKLRIDRERAESSKRVDDYRKELISEIDSIRGNFNAKLKSRYDKNIKFVDEDVKACDDNITELNKVLESLNDVRNDGVSRFIGARRIERMINLTEDKIGDIAGNVGKESMVYRLEPIIKNQGITCFGEFKKQPGSHHYQKRKKNDSYEIRISSRASQCKMPKDKYVCHILGIALMTTSQIIISDQTNKTLKLFRQNMTEVQKVCLSGEPFDVCVIDDDVCISYVLEKKVQIATLSGTCGSPQTKQTIKVGKKCRGVCYKNRELFVACGGGDSAEVRVYSLEGKLIRNFDRDAQGHKLFIKPCYVNTNNNGSLVLVGDCSNGVFALKVDGTLVWRYNNQRVLRGACYIAVDENDDCYVCGHDSSNIVKISSNGQKAEVVLDGIDGPTTMCYDGFNSRVIVTCDHGSCYSDTLLVYEIIKQRM